MFNTLAGQRVICLETRISVNMQRNRQKLNKTFIVFEESKNEIKKISFNLRRSMMLYRTAKAKK